MGSHRRYWVIDQHHRHGGRVSRVEYDSWRDARVAFDAIAGDERYSFFLARIVGDGSGEQCAPRWSAARLTVDVRSRMVLGSRTVSQEGRR